MVGSLKLAKGPLGEENLANPEFDRIVVVIEGTAAEKIYNSSKSAKNSGACAEKGTTYKQIGNVVCIQRLKKYSCDFAVVDGLKVEPGLPC